MSDEKGRPLKHCLAAAWLLQQSAKVRALRRLKGSLEGLTDQNQNRLITFQS